MPLFKKKKEKKKKKNNKKKKKKPYGGRLATPFDQMGWPSHP
jgi:hypothetical protein